MRVEVFGENVLFHFLGDFGRLHHALLRPHGCDAHHEKQRERGKDQSYDGTEIHVRSGLGRRNGRFPVAPSPPMEFGLEGTIHVN